MQLSVHEVTAATGGAAGFDSLAQDRLIRMICKGAENGDTRGGQCGYETLSSGAGSIRVWPVMGATDGGRRAPELRSDRG